MRSYDDTSKAVKEISSRRPLSGSGGFTLIELLVVMAISGVVMALMAASFASNRDALNLIDDIRNMEQNARIAVDFVSRDFRKAGMGGMEKMPFLPIDNEDSADWATAAGGFAAKGHPVLAGTDIVEIFWGLLPMPIPLEVGGTGAGSFNTNNANVKVPTYAMLGFPGYTIPMGKGAGALLQPYNLLIYDPDCPQDVACQQNITDGNETGNQADGLLTMAVYNRGTNQDDANRPHDCAIFEAKQGSISQGCPSGQAEVNIGEDLYYYVHEVEPGNPQLIRYQLGSGTHEVISNYIEDFQVIYGIDGLASDDDADQVVDVSEWLAGVDLTGTRLKRIKQVKVYMLVKSTREDKNYAVANALQNPPQIDNSTIVPPLGGGDFKRRRLIERTVRLRVANIAK